MREVEFVGHFVRKEEGFAARCGVGERHEVACGEHTEQEY